MPIKAQCTLAGFADRVSLSFRLELIHVDMGLTEASPGLELGRLMQTAVVCLLVAVIYKLLTVLLQLRDAAGKPPIFPGPDGHWLMGHAFMVRHRNAFNSGKTERFQATENIFVCVFFSGSTRWVWHGTADQMGEAVPIRFHHSPRSR